MAGPGLSRQQIVCVSVDVPAVGWAGPSSEKRKVLLNAYRDLPPFASMIHDPNNSSPNTQSLCCWTHFPGFPSLRRLTLSAILTKLSTTLQIAWHFSLSVSCEYFTHRAQDYQTVCEMVWKHGRPGSVKVIHAPLGLHALLGLLV